MLKRELSKRNSTSVSSLLQSSRDQQLPERESQNDTRVCNVARTFCCSRNVVLGSRWRVDRRHTRAWHRGRVRVSIDFGSPEAYGGFPATTIGSWRPSVHRVRNAFPIKPGEEVRAYDTLWDRTLPTVTAPNTGTFETWRKTCRWVRSRRGSVVHIQNI